VNSISHTRNKWQISSILKPSSGKPGNYLFIYLQYNYY
jgi:hypothetical protein